MIEKAILRQEAIRFILQITHVFQEVSSTPFKRKMAGPRNTLGQPFTRIAMCCVLKFHCGSGTSNPVNGVNRTTILPYGAQANVHAHSPSCLTLRGATGIGWQTQPSTALLMKMLSGTGVAGKYPAHRAESNQKHRAKEPQ